MASFTITGTTTTGQILASGETGFVGVNGAIADPSGPAIDSAGSVEITVLGAVQAFGGAAIDHDGDNLILDVGAAGFLGSSTSDTVNANITGSALIANYGVIQSDSDALDLRDSDGSATIRVVNHGHISGRSDGMVLQSGTGTTSVINTGTIDAQSYGIFNAFSGQSGVTFIENSGTIIGLTASYGGDDSTETINNSGVMQGDIDLDDGNDTLTNTGEIIGQVTGENGDDTVVNSGLIVGDVLLGSENDRYDGELGRIDGEVRGGTGEDTLIAGTNRTRLFGDADNDFLFGGAANDRLDGGAGNDRMEGRGGNDTYVVAAQFDSVVESAGGGIDRVISYISTTLAAHAEVLELVSGNINGTGNAQDNVIIGTSGANVLAGRGGSDELRGEAGADVFVFNTALDGSVDHLSDYNVADDKMQLDQDVFSALGLGFISAAELAIGSQAWTASQRIVYDPTSGAVSYDRDGSGAAEAIQFAQLEAGLGLVVWDFQVI